MVKGIERFREYFIDYSDQYVLIGGTACDISFGCHNSDFRTTRDLDVVLIVEALTPEFGQRFWEFIRDGGLTPIHLDDSIPSLSAILLNEAYYQALLQGREMVNGFSILKPNGLIPFKAKAWLDLNGRRKCGEHVDSQDLKKHKNDIIRIAAEFLLDRCELPNEVRDDMAEFIESVSISDQEIKNLKVHSVPQDTPSIS